MPATETAQTRDIGRLNAFTDGIMVVSMTLLVLNIEVPEQIAELKGGALLSALGEMWPRFLAYMLSFVVVAQYWRGYTQAFGGMKAADEGFVARNIWFLLVVGFVPFTSALLSENDGAVPTMLYAANMVGISLMLIALWWHANGAGLLGPVLTGRDRLETVLPWLQIAGVFGLSILIAPIHPGWAKLSWILLAVLPWVGRIRGR
jgi:uncharacterized membrane protein